MTAQGVPMRISTRLRLILLAALLGVAATLVPVATAVAGEFQINTCQADRANFSSQAFGTFATRGMKWKRACNPVGAGLRGLVTGNVVRAGRVESGAQSRFVLDAPAGTRFERLRWSGKITRRDCRYALQLYADRPDGPPIPIKNVRAGRGCPPTGHVQSSGQPRPRAYDIAGATRIIQRAVCVGGRAKHYCSARSVNNIRTFQAKATVIDSSGPTVDILQDTTFTQGAWVNGTQTVNYNASDNVGVRAAHALVAGVQRETHVRFCNYTRRIPCSNDPGRIEIDTTRLSDGSQPLQVLAIDAADNWNASPAVTVRVDNTAPGAVPVALDGADNWRAANDFDVAWQNPDEGDRAPIVAAGWRMCRMGAGECSTGSRAGTGIARLGDLTVPGPGTWELRMWRADAAGNSQPANASPPIALRYDPEPPTLSFQPTAAGDPTKVSVALTEKVSGVAGGQIELSQERSGTWQTLATQLEGDRLAARIDDARLPPGRYRLRAQASDLAGNVGVASAPQAITLPLRIQSAMRVGVKKTSTVGKRVGRRGHRRTLRRRVSVLRPTARVGFGSHASIRGQLTNRDGQPLPGQEIQVQTVAPDGVEHVLAILQTDARGRYRYRAAGSQTRTLRFIYLGTTTLLPIERRVRLIVPAAGSFRPSRKRVANGHGVVFSGRVRSHPIPAAGKLVEIQVRQPSGDWTTFRTMRTDAQGRWALRYRFRYVRCHTAYRIRLQIPTEAGYPFATGHSDSRKVMVQGANGPCP